MAVDIRNPSSPPSIPAGDGFMWKWNAERGQWVRVAAMSIPQNPATNPPLTPPQTVNQVDYVAYLRGLPIAQRDQLTQQLAVQRNPAEFAQWYATQTPQTQQFLQSIGGLDPARQQQLVAEARSAAFTPDTRFIPTPVAGTRPAPPDTTGPGKWREPVLQEPDKPEREKIPEQSARAIIRSIIEPLGLGELEDMLYAILLEDQDYSPQRLMVEIRRTPQYARRFPGMAARQAAGLPAISEGDYLDFETKYKTLMRNAGLPTGFYDSPDDFAKFIGGGVEPDELGRRIQNGYQAVAQADPSVLATMRQFYGVTDGELAAYMLDPQRATSLIEQQVATAQIGAAAARQGFGQAADRAASERMQRLGVTGQEASQAFGTLGRSRELLTALDRGETALDVTETALALTGRGSAEAAQRFATQARRRVARFEGGGRFATQGQEVTGLRTT
jgi:hypothetical protein